MKCGILNTNPKSFASALKSLAIVTCILALTLQSSNAQSTYKMQADLRQQFLNPPPSASPWVFWYWMQAAVSKEGITADLDAMKQAGIGGAYMMFIKGVANPPYTDTPALQLSSRWWQMVRHAVNEADRNGIKLGIHVSDGFALAGGPWITPEMSMQKVVWTQTHVKGGNPISIVLPQPQTNEGYYKDIAVFAFPSTKEAGMSTQIIKPVITSSKDDSVAQFLTNPDNSKNFTSEENCWIQYAFEKPFTCRSIVIRSKTNYQSNRLLVQASSDGKQFSTVKQLQSPRHGWQDWDEFYTHAIPLTTAKYFRFVFEKNGSEPGAEDLDAAKWKPSLKVLGIELSSDAKIDQFEGKNGSVWRISPATTNQQVPPDVCVPLKKLVNLTGKLDKDGTLHWQAPAGNWTILRIGHTSTGHKNETAGGGKGLECDKFNQHAVALQLHKWFEEFYRQCDEGALRCVLQYLHVDSWECGSQNWSANFADEFKRRRGYDLLPYLPLMAGIPIENAAISERVLHDVRATIAELVNDVFFKTVGSFAKKKGLLVSAESVAPTMVGDGMLHYNAVDVPMGEFWLRSPTHDKPNDMLDAVSGAHVYSKPVVQAEGFTELRMAWDEHPGMMKTIADRNFALGINKMVFHVFMHNPWMDRKPGMTLDAIGTFFQRDQTWWKQNRAWVDYVKRCQALLQLGKPVADIAVFTGNDYPRRALLPDRLVGAMPGIFGKEIVSGEEKRLKNEGQPLRQMPAGVTHSANISDPAKWGDALHGYSYDSFNEDALLSLSKANNNTLELRGGASYKLLVLPGVERMTPGGNVLSKNAAAKIIELTNGGLTVLANGNPYEMIQGLKTSGALVNEKTGWVETGNGKIVQGPYTSNSFEQLGIEPDCIVADENGSHAENIAWTHRQGDDFDVYFVSNQLDSMRTVHLSLRVTNKLPELWYPLDGNILPADGWRMEGGRTILPIVLERNQSVFVVLQKPGTNSNDAKSNPGSAWHPVKTLQESWMVSFDSAFGGPLKPVRWNHLQDWSQNADTSIKYFSGTAAYSTTLVVDEETKGKSFALNLGDVQNMAEVFVNGQSCGIAWTPPFQVDITKAIKNGENDLRIEVTNTWHNRLVGDSRLPKDHRYTQMTAPYPPPNSPLLPAGLLGPVVLLKKATSQ